MCKMHTTLCSPFFFLLTPAIGRSFARHRPAALPHPSSRRWRSREVWSTSPTSPLPAYHLHPPLCPPHLPSSRPTPPPRALRLRSSSGGAMVAVVHVSSAGSGAAGGLLTDVSPHTPLVAPLLHRGSSSDTLVGHGDARQGTTSPGLQRAHGRVLARSPTMAWQATALLGLLQPGLKKSLLKRFFPLKN
jgi:hypothetical protein